MSPAEFAAEALHADIRSVVDAGRIKHGQTNESWLVRFERDAVVVRISNAAEQSLQIDRSSEAVILQMAATAGIGAPVLLCDPARRVLVTRYLGPTWSESDARELRNIARLGAALRQLHSLSPPAGVHRVELRAVVDEYLQTLKAHGRHADASHSERAGIAAALLDSNAPPCLCHNDIHCLNIVGDSQIRFIDWEYAGVGTPLFDLASVCVNHRYDESRRSQLLASYGHPQLTSMESLQLACELFDYIRELWTQVRSLPA